MQYTGFSPRPDFIPAELEQAYAQYDPELAKQLLDEIGMVDTNGDGFRELPNGDKLVLNLQFATQGIAGEVVELVGQNWADVGVQTTVKEVTPDEYRSAQSSNQLDVMMWRKGQPLAIHMGDNSYWVPPFDGYFDIRTGMLWAEWLDTNGASGRRAAGMGQGADRRHRRLPVRCTGLGRAGCAGREAGREHGRRTCCSSGPCGAGADLPPQRAEERAEFKTRSYEYYRTYPYRAAQWFLDE